MINSNLGKLERGIRLVLAMLLIGWVLSRGSLGMLEGVALLAAFALLWNSFFGRCYLWKWLGINTQCQQDSCRGEDCSGESRV